MVERDDVDWQCRRFAPPGERAAPCSVYRVEEAETGQDGNASPSMQWGSWVGDRMMLPEEPAETSAMGGIVGDAPSSHRERPGRFGDNTRQNRKLTVPKSLKAGGRGDVEDAGGDPTAEEETLVADNVAPDGDSRNSCRGRRACPARG